jgi:predicted enzyme related to lactoylglutathione lyase
MIKLSRIAPELPVSDLKRALNYYEQKLGFQVASEMPDGKYAIVERDDIAIHLFQDGSHPQSPVALHIFTNGLEELCAELRNRGASFSQKHHAEALGKP